MGTTLTGKRIKDTYDGLIKVTDNEPLSTSAVKRLNDGLGNHLKLVRLYLIKMVMLVQVGRYYRLRGVVLTGLTTHPLRLFTILVSTGLMSMPLENIILDLMVVL